MVNTNYKSKGSKKPLAIVVLGLVLLSAIGLAYQYEHPNQVCLLKAGVYGPIQQQQLQSDFQSHFGSDAGVDWALFARATEKYLSAAYYSCADKDKAAKECVRTKILQVEALLTNKSGRTPRERWHDLLALEAPRYCLEKEPKIDARSEAEANAWRAAGQKNYHSVNASLSKVTMGKEQLKRDETVEALNGATSTQAEQGLKPAAKALIPRLAYNQGIALYMLGDSKEAAMLFSRALSAAAKEARLHYGYGLTQLRAFHFEQALKSFDTAKSLHFVPEDAIDTLSLKINLGLAAAYRGQNEFMEADKIIDFLLKAASRSLGPKHLVLGQLYYERAWIRSDYQRYGAAQKFLRDAIKLWTPHYGESHPKLLDTQIAMALAQIEGDLAYDAVETLEDALAMNEALGENNLKKIEISFLQALAHADNDDYLDRALSLASDALLQLRMLDEQHAPLEAGIQRWLEAL